MAINNPYIPGDPYSYDLKWLVAKVKQILAQLGTLDEAIEAKIFEGFLEHSIVQFKTVPEMLAADITDGSIVLTLGYHEAGDQGGTFYLVKDFNPAQCAMDYFLTLDNNKQIAIPVIVTPYVTPEMFGAYGDGEHDDATALQTAIDTAFAEKIPVHFSAKTYNTGTELIIHGGEDNTHFGNVLTGSNRGSTVIVATSAMDSVLHLTSETAAIASVMIEKLIVNGGTLAANGVYFDRDSANCRFSELKISDTTETGVKTANSHYLNVWDHVRIDRTDIGFSMKQATGWNGALDMHGCYAQSCRIGYSIRANYSTLNACCGDNITETVFDLERGTFALISPGAESVDATAIFKGRNRARITIVNPATLANYTNADAYHFDLSNSFAVVVGGYVLADAPSTVPGGLFKIDNGASIKFINTEILSEYAKDGQTNAIQNRVDVGDAVGACNIRHDGIMAYIGYDNTGDEDLSPIEKLDGSATRANAIYFAAGKTPSVRYDDRNITGNASPTVGDLILSRAAKDNCLAGWIVSETSSTQWGGATFKPIPTLMSGSTANRPTGSNLTPGFCYLDTTLVKPVWWTGTRWVDATGTTA